MTPIQPILIALIAVIGGIYLTMHRSRLVFRLANFALAGVGMWFVSDPDLTTRIAHKVGVGRGTDLLLYMLCLATASAFLQLYRQNRSLEEKLTAVVRQVAIQGAQEHGTKRS
jgi:hypothetical protein